MGAQPHLPFGIAYLDGASVQRALADERVMAAIRFGPTTHVDADDPRQWTVGLPELGGSGTAEVWYSQHPLQLGSAHGIGWACNEEVLLAHLLIEAAAGAALDRATDAAYRRIFPFIRRQGYPYLLRVWNYFPDINLNENGLERYRAFCQGRHRALVAQSGDFAQGLPAACALGTRRGGLLVYFLAAKVPGVQIENPRQVSAFHYPPQYGRKSPAFSRSVMVSWGTIGRHLLISGTASIVGHATHHAGDPHAQWHETLNNLEALLDRAGRQARTPLRLSLLKAYVRDGIDVAILRDTLVRRLDPAIPILFLRADICRGDLLVEIEGLASGTDGY